MCIRDSTHTADSAHRLAGGLNYPVIPLHVDGSKAVDDHDSAKPNAKLTAEDNDNLTTGRKRQRAFLKIQDGCRYKCTYCIVTQARGEERSHSIESLVAEVQAMEAAGMQEVVLTGVHVGGYGSDTGESLSSLVSALINDTSMPRIRFASVEPWDLEPALLRLFDNKRLMPHMHLPLQSGADSVLKRMARRCRTSEFKHLVDSLRNQYPDFNVTTDIIVGFPGESEKEWQQTMAFAQEMAFGHIHVFPFSARTGTHAATLTDQVNPAVKKSRAEQLRLLAQQSRRNYLQRFVGSAVDVLWESGKAVSANDALSGHPDPRQIHRYQGYTPNFLRVFVDVPDSRNTTESGDRNWLSNKLLPATITGVLQHNQPDQQSALSARIHSTAAEF